jgi:hypothetical protein
MSNKSFVSLQCVCSVNTDSILMCICEVYLVFIMGCGLI